LLNDPNVIQASKNLVRVIVRRPHAYFFIKDKLAPKTSPTMKGTPAGVTFSDGTVAPLPGAYLMNAEGVVEASVALSNRDAKSKLLKMLGQ
jgi:hypothetical protein